MIKIVIDPGHGGSDRFNRGSNGYIEADGVLDISKRLKVKLESTGAFDVKLTRDKDMTLSLTERGKFASAFKADFFISEHTNAGPSNASGSEVFYSVDLPGTKELAAELSAAVSKALNINDRGAKTRESQNHPNEDYYGVIDVAQDGGVPNVFIIESAFHSNPNEEKLLLDANKRDAIAEAQCKVICKHFKVLYPVIKLAPKPVVHKYVGKATVQGDKGDTVKLIQTKLNAIGFPCGKVDGSFGTKTLAAVKAFQTARKLKVDGKVGPITWAKLFN